MPLARPGAFLILSPLGGQSGRTAPATVTFGGGLAVGMGKPPAQATVLLLDDEVEILEGVASYLEHAFPGMRVLKASNGADALQLLRQERIDLVLADYRMPGQNGLEVLMEAEKRLPHVPRVMFTAYPDLDVAVSALNEARVRRFLVKPLAPETLQGVIKQLLSDPEDGRISP